MVSRRVATANRTRLERVVIAFTVNGDPPVKDRTGARPLTKTALAGRWLPVVALHRSKWTARVIASNKSVRQSSREMMDDVENLTQRPPRPACINDSAESDLERGDGENGRLGARQSPITRREREKRAISKVSRDVHGRERFTNQPRDVRLDGDICPTTASFSPSASSSSFFTASSRASEPFPSASRRVH